MQRPAAPHPLLLLVDDDRMVSYTLVAMLEDYYDTIVTASAAAALLRLSAPPPPAILLLDCLLPNGGVPQILHAADALHIPVVLTSGDPGQAIRYGGKRAYLQKPFDQETLLSVLDAARS